MAEDSEGPTSKKGCLKWVLFAGLGVIAIMAGMAIFHICPPPGPWPAPPWCEGGIRISKMPGQEAEAPVPTAVEEIAVEPTVLPTPVGPRVEISGKWIFSDPGDEFMQPTIISFAGTAGPNIDDIRMVHDLGLKYIYQVSLWQHDYWHTLEDLPVELKQAFTVDLDGNPIIIQEDFIHLNTLDPAWQDWLIQDMLFKLESGADGIIMDETSGSAQAVWLGGTFDEITMDGFRQYLSGKYAPDELVKKGIGDIENFNYREYLLEKGYDDDFRQGRPLENPLGRDFRDFLQLETNRFIARLMDEALAYAEKNGREISISANMDPFSQNDSLMTYADRMDVFTFEHSYFADWWRADNPNYAKLAYGYPVTPQIAFARGLGMNSNVMMILRDYSVLRDKGEPVASRMVAHAMAETFAAGGSFCYWDFDKAYAAEGPYMVNRQLIRPYYDFLHSYPELFLDAEPQPSRIAIVAPPRVDWSDGSPNSAVQGYAWMLLESHIPFEMINLDRINDFEVVYTSGFSWSDEEVQTLLDYMSQGGIVIAEDGRFASLDENFQTASRPELGNLKRNGKNAFGEGAFIFSKTTYGQDYYHFHRPNDLQVAMKTVVEFITPNQAPENVVMLPWVGEDTVVLHVINNNYDGDYIKQQDLVLRVQLPEGFESAGKSLTVYPVETGAAEEIPFQVEDGWLVFTLPSLDIWSVAALK